MLLTGIGLKENVSVRKRADYIIEDSLRLSVCKVLKPYVNKENRGLECFLILMGISFALISPVFTDHANAIAFLAKHLFFYSTIDICTAPHRSLRYGAIAD